MAERIFELDCWNARPWPWVGALCLLAFVSHVQEQRNTLRIEAESADIISRQKWCKHLKHMYSMCRLQVG